MRFSIFTASTPDWTPEEVAATAAEQGWDGIEWRVVDQQDAAEPGFWVGNRATWPLTGLEDAVPEIRRLTEDAGLAISGLGGYVRCDDHENVERMLAAAAATGAGRVRVTQFPLGLDAYPALFERARSDMTWVAERAAAHGVTALVELHHRTITASASSALRLLDGLDPAAVGVIHDLGNLVIEGHEDHLAAFQLLGPYLAHVHVKNVRFVQDGTDEDGAVRWRDEWAPMRDGIADVPAYLRALREHGYDGWITSEDFSTEQPLLERTAANLAYLRGVLARIDAAGGER